MSILHIGLELLDRQLLDSDGMRCGKVDDLEFTTGEDGAPMLTAIVTGNGGLTSRLAGWPRGVARVMWRRISRNPAGPRGRVPIEAVKRIDYDIHLTIAASDAGLDDRERWAGQLIRKIPGAQDAG